MSGRGTLFAGVLLSIALLSIMGCNGHDSDFFPYGLKGFDVYVYDIRKDQEFYEGHIEASYFSRNKGLNDCQVQARAAASRRNLDEWSYVCCTVTSSSNCATKVK